MLLGGGGNIFEGEFLWGRDPFAKGSPHPRPHPLKLLMRSGLAMRAWEQPRRKYAVRRILRLS